MARIESALPVTITVGKDQEIEVDPKEMSSALKACIGRYFTLTPATRNPSGRSEIMVARAVAKEKKDWATMKFCDQLLRGWPKPISNFTLSCDFKLISPAAASSISSASPMSTRSAATGTFV